MNQIQELLTNKEACNTLSIFLDQYSLPALEQALHLYTNTHQAYICKTKTSISKINIYDIFYLEINKHNITVHTQDGTYQKYGSLSNELKHLAPYGFVNCNQSCIVSLNKIHTIQHMDITLINGETLHMSRKYIPRVLIAFSQHKSSKMC